MSPVHHLVLVATDGGRPRSLSSEATLTVHVVDANDNAPAFEEAVYTMKVSVRLIKVTRSRYFEPESLKFMLQGVPKKNEKNICQKK